MWTKQQRLATAMQVPPTSVHSCCIQQHTTSIAAAANSTRQAPQQQSICFVKCATFTLVQGVPCSSHAGDITHSFVWTMLDQNYQCTRSGTAASIADNSNDQRQKAAQIERKHICITWQQRNCYLDALTATATSGARAPGNTVFNTKLKQSTQGKQITAWKKLPHSALT